MENANFTSQSQNSFKIKAKELSDNYESENIHLITIVNGSPKKIPCSGKNDKDSSDDKDYYFLHLKEYNQFAYENRENIEHMKKYDLDNDYNIKYDDDIPLSISSSKQVFIINKLIQSEDILRKLTAIYGDRLTKYNIFYSMTILLSNYIYSNYTRNYQQVLVGFNGRRSMKLDV